MYVVNHDVHKAQHVDITHQPTHGQVAKQVGGILHVFLELNRFQSLFARERILGSDLGFGGLACEVV